MSKGFIPALATREIWSKQRKGRIPWNKGKRGIYKTSEETKIKQSLVKRSFYGGHTFSEASKKKMSETRKRLNISGEKHYNWKGGVSSIRNRLYHTEKYSQWRQQVFLRDDFTCQECHKRGLVLEAHHIKSVKKLLLEVKNYLPLINLYEATLLYTPFWDIFNGITLCQKCHNKKRGNN